MSDMIADGLAWLSEQLEQNCSTSVTYRRGSASCTFDAVYCSQRLRTSDRQGNTKVERAGGDFVFASSRLDLGAGVVEPEEGDFVDARFGAITKRFQVMPAAGEPGWYYCDPFQIDVLCHTKYVGTV